MVTKENKVITSQKHLRNALLLAVLLAGLAVLALIVNNHFKASIIILCGLAFVLFIPLILRRPDIPIIGSLLICFTPLGYRFGYLLILCIFPLLILWKQIRRCGPMRLDLIGYLWIAITILGVFTIPLWHDVFLGVKGILHLAVMPMLLHIMISNDLLNQKQICSIIKTGVPLLLILVVLSSLVSIMIIVVQYDVGGLHSAFVRFRRLEIADNGSNRLAGLLVFLSFLCFCLRWAWEKKYITKITIDIGIITALLIALITLSRGAMIAFFAMVALYLFGRFLLGKGLKIFEILGMIIIALIFLKPFIEKIIFRFQTMSADYAFIYRLLMWYENVLRTIRSPIIGGGPGQFTYGVFGEAHDDPHNLFLRYGVEFGGLSVLLIFSIIMIPMRKLLLLFKKNKDIALKLFIIFVPALMGTFIHSQMDYIINSYSYGILFWLLWAIFTHQVKLASNGKECYCLDGAVK